MVRFSLVGANSRHDIDFGKLPEGSKPIYYREMQLDRNLSSGNEKLSCLKHYFGYEYKNGKNKVKEVHEI